uniref:Uncharacterized protein n=1 Tax=Nelumbo nucifera TaxID=4432 RepID=A0A822XST0_NELNU|nr:TPA_asm: hypothetical protein HUJ06_023419 [Nelumbo nucifera]
MMRSCKSLMIWSTGGTNKDSAMSIEALAMAGLDYTECGIDLDELDQIPPYLLFEKGSKGKIDGCSRMNENKVRDDEQVKAWLVAWAKDVASSMALKFKAT